MVVFIPIDENNIFSATQELLFLDSCDLPQLEDPDLCLDPQLCDRSSGGSIDPFLIHFKYNINQFFLVVVER